MKQVRNIIVLSMALMLPLVSGGTVAVAESITHEIQVTAIVPARRDILVDKKGQIVQITSNTTEDVTPTVYAGNVSEKNKQQLTAEIYEQYREHIPEGTAKYGILYQRTVISMLSVKPAG